MTEKENSLSDKILPVWLLNKYEDNLKVKDVKEFIKKLKEEYLKLGSRVFNGKSDQDVLDLIDKLAGEKLIK